MMPQIAWSLLAIFSFLALAIALTILGKKLCLYLTYQYENRRGYRNSNMENHPQEVSQQRVGYYTEKRVIDSTPICLKSNENNYSYQESDKQTHEQSIAGDK